jgi:hypothetical protein
VKTERASQLKFFHRQATWGRWLAVAGLAAILVSLQWLHWSRPPRGTELLLREGSYRVISVRDAITFECEPAASTNGGTDPLAQPLTVRLLGVTLLEPTQPASAANAAALRATLDFLRDCPDGMVHLQFAQHRFDRSLTPLATLHARNRELHRELLEQGLVRSAFVPGQRSR